MRELVVDGKALTRDGPAYVIAEIGHNHQGDVEKAKALIHSAKECGADAVKLQKRDSSTSTRGRCTTRRTIRRTYGEHREALELSAAESLELREFSREEGVTLFGTVFDAAAADFLGELGMPAFKAIEVMPHASQRWRSTRPHVAAPSA